MEELLLGRRIGKGASGTVYTGRLRSLKTKLAVKTIVRDETTALGLRRKERACKEAIIMSTLEHKHICKCYGVRETGSHVYVLTKYAPGGDLLDKLNKNGPMSENEARKLFKQLILAITYMHGKGIVHRDIKPENLLLDRNGNLKVADFGFAHEWSPLSQFTDSMGTFPYCAPEVACKLPYNGPEQDLWSCGTGKNSKCGYQLTLQGHSLTSSFHLFQCFL